LKHGDLSSDYWSNCNNWSSSAPTALTATATIIINGPIWSDSDEYECITMCIGFQICQLMDLNESDILVDTTTETTYTVTELTSSTDYTFIVKSKDEAGNLSAASDQETTQQTNAQQI
jgi:hypothetical protein